MEFLHSPIIVLAILTLCILFAQYLAQTKYGKQVGAALIVILLGAVLANISVIPSASNKIDLYGHIFHYIAPISIFYLTLGVNLKKIRNAGMPMLILFILGSFATVAGVILAMWIVQPEAVLGELAPAIAGMITGTYTGGSVNFNAVALHYKVNESGVLYAGAVAADNVMTTLWVLATLAIPVVMRVIWPLKTTSAPSSPRASNQSEQPQAKEAHLSLQSLMLLVPTGIVAFVIAEYVAQLIPVVPSILVITTIGIVLAQFDFFHEQKGAHLLGLYLVYLFLVVIGAYCEIAAISELGEIGLTLLLFVGCVVLFHGIIIISIGRYLVKDYEMIAIASQANVGGGTTAMALAETFNRSELIVPAILIGTVGNALGTYLGFMVVSLF